MTTRSVALLEGPHDLEGYGAVAERRLTESGTLPPAAYGVRMIAAGIGGGGGKEQLPKLAGLARDLGFHVRVMIDNDKPGSDTGLLAELDGLAEQVIRLPERTAVERALARGIPADAQRAALCAISDLYGLGLDVDHIPDDGAGGGYRQAVEAEERPAPAVRGRAPGRRRSPLAAGVLDTLTRPAGQQVLTELQNP